jgi:prevent-host-death family protein
MSSYSILQAQDQLSRLVDEVLAGEQVTLTRDGKPVVELRPAQPADRRTTKETLDWLRKRRAALPNYDGDSVAAIREMRDDF